MFFSPEDTFEYIPSLPAGNLVEFGVYHGDIMGRIMKSAHEQNRPFYQVWGFDSWEGLPEETIGLWNNPDWPKGAFSVKEAYDLETNQSCMKFVHDKVRSFVGNDDTELCFVSGFFDQSLTDEIGKKLQNSCSYLHVDCDLYKSTIDCLQWVFTHQILKEGCLVRFDDWLYNGQWAGNNRAFYEITQRFHVQWTTIADNVYVYERME